MSAVTSRLVTSSLADRRICRSLLSWKKQLLTKRATCFLLFHCQFGVEVHPRSRTRVTGVVTSSPTVRVRSADAILRMGLHGCRTTAAQFWVHWAVVDVMRDASDIENAAAELITDAIGLWNSAGAVQLLVVSEHVMLDDVPYEDLDYIFGVGDELERTEDRSLGYAAINRCLGRQNSINRE